MADIVSRATLDSAAKFSGSLQTIAHFLGKHVWSLPIIAAGVIALVGWWVYWSVEYAMREQRRSALTTILETEVTGIRAWFGEQKINAELIAGEDYLVPLAEELLATVKGKPDDERKLREAKAQATLRARLKERLQICKYYGFSLVAPNGTVIASDQDMAIGRTLAGYRKEFFDRVLAGTSAVSKPFHSQILLPDDQGEMRAYLPTMFTATPLSSTRGQIIAALGLRIPPNDNFTRILRKAQVGKTGDTYAFDKNGMLLSQTRFDDQLREIGLLVDMPGSQSILTVELRDPGVNMVRGDRPTVKRADQPLTRMAAAAIDGTSGIDVDGYRDYRGVLVVGAWEWLPDLNFGVATEIGADEAFRPAYILMRVFWALIALLMLSALAIFLGTILINRQQRALRKATLAAKQLGQYTLEEKLGAGGMGTVYRARHALLRRPTAVKLLDIDKISDSAIARFQREVQLTSQLNHPNTIAVYDYGKTPEGIFFYAMEFLDGINLEDLVATHGALPEGRVIQIIQQVCGSLAEAHSIGLIHRDIKPANIVLNNRGGVADMVKVLDFGLVKALGGELEAYVTAANALIGTPMYLAPESINHPEKVDAGVDLYAIGAVGYFLLTGTPVFGGTSVMEICMQHVRTPPQPPSERCGRPISPSLEAILLRCLAKKKEDRPASAKDLREELASCPHTEMWSTADAESWWAHQSNQGATAIRETVAAATISLPNT